MTRTGVVAALCLALPSWAAAQSLGEAARKEQERRDTLRKSGVASRTLTEEDAAHSKGRLANDPNEPASASPSAAATPKSTSSGRAIETVTDDPAARTGEAYWRGRVAVARSKLTSAQRRHEALQAMVHLGQPAMYDENGKRVMFSIHQLKARADAAAAALGAAQQAFDDVLEQGRRAGALPGWLR